MTRAEAIEIRTAQLQGAPVDPELARTAIQVLKDSAGTLTVAEYADLRKKTGKARPKPEKKAEPKPEPKLVIPVFTKQTVRQVVQALKPWALLSKDAPVPQGDHWPLRGVDIDAVHHRGRK